MFLWRDFKNWGETSFSLKLFFTLPTSYQKLPLAPFHQIFPELLTVLSWILWIKKHNQHIKKTNKGLLEHFTCLFSDKTLASKTHSKHSKTNKEFFVCDNTKSTEKVVVANGTQRGYALELTTNNIKEVTYHWDYTEGKKHY